jgi:hypothetical protein
MVVEGMFSKLERQQSIPRANPAPPPASSNARPLRDRPSWPVGVSSSGENVVHAVSHAPRRDGKHAAKLAAPITPTVAPGGIHASAIYASLAASTSAVCFSRKASSAPPDRVVLQREDRDGEQGRVFRARGAAWQRPDGKPPGICTMESRESTPNASPALDRHAQHRQPRVCGDHAGRCAAPPAPAMMTCSPRAAAPLANSAMRSGCDGTTTWLSCVDAELFQHVGACRRVSQSDWLPMTMATSGAALTRRRK